MALKTRYVCELCSHTHSKAWGWCQNCGARGSLHEDVADTAAPPLPDVTAAEWSTSQQPQRLLSGWEEFDRICGGGIVPGSVVLLSGEPGIGKSTFLTQISSILGDRTIYFSGEETLGQISDRARRLQLKDFRILSTDSLELITSTIKKSRPQLAVIDSIQTLRSQDGGGSMEQLRTFTMELVQCAKHTDCALIVVGHVTKTGGLAGPKLLEHMVDVVLTFEGNEGVRTLRSSKNRFGSTDEIALFAMTPSGLQAIADPSAHLCHFRSEPTVGSIIFPSREGSRLMLVEIQALVAKSHLQLPRRSVVGWCPNRAAMLLAIMENHAKIKLYDRDVYINVVGGIRITDTSNADLSVALAILSSVTNTPIPVAMAAFGEVTLSGDVRPAYQAQERINICARYRLDSVVCADNVPGRHKVLKIKSIAQVLGGQHRSVPEEDDLEM